jgi:hypothetical protein
MTIKELFDLEIGDGISILNEPFNYVGHAEIQLDNGQEMRWLYDSESRLLTLAPSDEELMIFSAIEEELEPENEVMLYMNKEYEFSYEDAGTTNEIVADTDMEEEGPFMFVDYQAAGGGVIRVISNTNTGESITYVGQTVSEEDISEM